ncbi:MAG: DNA replication/repair protein RecF [Bacillota bacterium]
MLIKNVKLINFRNYGSLELILDPKINVFVGDNAQGKTNIIEAIYMSGTGKSFRSNKDRELIKFDKDKGYVKVEAEKKHDNVVVELKLEEDKKKQIKVNGVVLSKNSDILGSIYVVIFSPEDLKLVKEGPAERRKFIDTEISNIKPKYYYHLHQYHRVIMQRNHLLKKIQMDKKFMSTLEVWDEKMIDLGTRLIMDRNVFIKRMSTLSRLIHRKITDNQENFEVKYVSNIPLAEEYEGIYNNFKIKLKKALEVDIMRGMTTVGPHRDDLDFFVNGIDIKTYGSQGQQRTSALSLKLAEIELVKAETAEYPILLLDDVMSELDIHRQQFLIKSLRDIQTFITTTELKALEAWNVHKKSIFYVEKANISRAEEEKNV